jgi:hypothetical protein
MGDFVHLTCGACTQSWWSDPDRRMGRLAVLLKRRQPSVNRCPRCFGTDVRLSLDLHLASAGAGGDELVIDLTGAKPVIWLDGVNGKERSDLSFG